MRAKAGRRLVGLALADSLDRIVSPWESDRRAGSDKNPSRLLQKQQREAFFRWLEARYQSEARFLEAAGQDPLAASFYTEAARELRLAEQGSIASWPAPPC